MEGPKEFCKTEDTAEYERFKAGVPLSTRDCNTYIDSNTFRFFLGPSSETIFPFVWTLVQKTSYNGDTEFPVRALQILTIL